MSRRGGKISLSASVPCRRRTCGVACSFLAPFLNRARPLRCGPCFITVLQQLVVLCLLGICLHLTLSELVSGVCAVSLTLPQVRKSGRLCALMCCSCMSVGNQSLMCPRMRFASGTSAFVPELVVSHISSCVGLAGKPSVAEMGVGDGPSQA